MTDKNVVDAENALKVAGLTLGPQVDEFDPARPAGTVIGTARRPARRWTAGAAVQLVVSSSARGPRRGRAPVRRTRRPR